MATNPMQKRARNSLLLGIVLGLLIGTIFIAVLFYQLTNLQKQIEANKLATRKIYVLSTNVKSGEPITSAMLVQKEALQDVIPTDYIGIEDITIDTIAKLDLTKGTVLSSNLVTKSDEKVTNDLREQEYNMLNLPQQLEVGAYVDIRLRLPNGQDYIVVSKKYVKNVSEDTIWINMYEEETVAMSNAIVEAYKMTGSRLYATTYVEPGNQENAIPTYVPSNEVINLINADKNITDEARRGLAERYKSELRSGVNSELNNYTEEAKSNVETKVQQEITNSKEARKEYIDALNASME